MKILVYALIALTIFFVSAALILDAATYALGKPSRGVSYGIGIHYLNIALAIVGSVALACTYWFRRSLGITIGTGGVFACVLTLFAQPGIEMRIAVALVISGVLAITIVGFSKTINSR